MSQYNLTFTVFTPTFNRAQTLERVYVGLKSQSFRNFEWLIVDDGSTDNTLKLIKSWQSKSNFPIRYFYQENAGKHIAYNHGVHLAVGTLFIILDSNDSCVPEALERFKTHWEQIFEQSKDEFACVSSLCQDPSGNVIGKALPQDIVNSDWLEMYYLYDRWFERWECYRTDVLLSFPFPSITNTYIPESYLWFQLAKKYKTRFINESLRIYWNKQPELDKKSIQITRLHPQKASVGCFFAYQSALNNNLDYFSRAPIKFLKHGAQFTRYGLHNQMPINQMLKNLHSLFAKLIWLCTFPIGIAFFFKDTLSRKK